ncbi:P-loop containing nucleoside triphosphate hydrolase protein [Daldinia sp. FL1419]|nr:P-loop containing nucleoside triphosphate hydrolase protein [Daldinia sp. FL1419]
MDDLPIDPLSSRTSAMAIDVDNGPNKDRSSEDVEAKKVNGTGVDHDMKENEHKSKKKNEKQSELLNELAKDDGMELRDVMDEVFKGNINQVYSYTDLSLGDRRKEATRRLMQSQLYLQLVEDRILDIEKKLRKILNEPEAQSDGKSSASIPPSKEVINELTWSEYGVKADLYQKTKPSNWLHVAELDSTPRPVIEVLIEEPRYDLVRRTEKIELPGEQHDQSIPGEVENLDNQSVSNHMNRITSATSREKLGTPHRIRIRSPVLLKVLKEVTGLETVIGQHHHKLVFFKPFKLLVEYTDKLQDHLERISSKAFTSNEHQNVPKETETDEARTHLGLLCDAMDKYLKPKINMRHRRGHFRQRISFDDLWYIFKTGIEVRTTGKSQVQLYRILKVTGGRDVISPWRDAPTNHASAKLKEVGYSTGAFVIECFYMHFDGKQYGPVNQTFQISKFDGEREITSFPVIPLDIEDGSDSLRRELLERGRKFAELSNPVKTAHKLYNGLTLDKRPEQVESEVIIDFKLSFVEKSENKPEIGVENLVDDDPRELSDLTSYCPFCNVAGCCGNDVTYEDYEVDEKDRNEFRNQKRSILNATWAVDQLTDDQMVLLPPKVFGFVLHTRRWATFDIDLLREVEYKNSWKNLVIKDSIKDTILALVEYHQKPHNQEPHSGGMLLPVDLVQGKGKGLTILLHGEPGVGKTSTAECVADHTKRPLFPITCGDIGDNALMVETNLERNFQLAHKWGCVLLLDEADIFLSKRTNHDITRNAIVSVFLRTLEYYSGILFLTTNRVGTIDRAFKSRIHLSLYYPKLNQKRTLQIWENNLDRLKEELNNEKVEFEFPKRDIMKYAEEQYKEWKGMGVHPWNGRQIRNAFQTAIAIANYEARTQGKILEIGKRHFAKVAKRAIEFDGYLKELSLGKDDSQLARDGILRLDNWPGYSVAARRADPIRAYERGNGRKKARKGRGSEEDSSEDLGFGNPSDDDDSDDDDDDDDDDEEGFDSSRSDDRDEVRKPKNKLKRKKRSSDEDDSSEEDLKAKKKNLKKRKR